MGGHPNRFVRVLALPLTLAGAALGAPAFAQSTQAEDTEVTAVVVTAQKREENLQDVPISVAVVTADRLEALQLNSATDLQYLVPGLAAPTQAGPRNFGFFVRGVGTTTFSSETIEPSTAFVVDGVVMGQGGRLLVDLPDIERIEVLRGPQGTLFGKNSSSGVINVVTRRPSAEFEFRGAASWAWPDDDRRATAYVSGPITEDLRFSLSGRRNLTDGYILNVADGRRFNDRDEYGFRGKLEWQANDAMRATLIGDYWKRDASCCIWTWARFGPPISFTEQLAIDAGVTPGRGNLRQNIDGDVFTESRNYGLSLQLDYELGSGHTVTSITSHRTFETRDGLDSDSSTFDVLNVNFGDHSQRQVSQELRLTSPVGGFADYVAGLYFFRTEVDSYTRQIFPTVPFPFFDREVDVYATTRNIAAFGQANLHFTDQLTLVLGARVLNERQEVDKARSDPRFRLFDSASVTGSEDALTWRVALQYDFSDDVMAFASATRGFKGGGFDSNIAVQGLLPVGPEEPMSYEAGFRAAWPESRFTLNVTGFWADIKGYQTASRDSVTLTFPLSNGDAETKGIEVDFSWQPVRDVEFFLSGAGAYTKAEWGDFPNAPCYASQTAAQGCIGGVVQDLTGEPLPFAPELGLNLSADYARPVGEAFRLTGNLEVSYRSEQVIGFPNSPDAEHEAYTLVNAAVGFGAEDGRWKLSVFGKNLTDKHYNSFSFNSGFSVGQYRVHESRRIVGVGLDVAF